MEFKSHSGVKYWYDNNTGLSLPTNSLLVALLQKHQTDTPLDAKLNNEDDLQYYQQFIKKLDKIKINPKNKQRNEYKPEELKTEVLRYGLQQITLGITEKCNLSCKYCIYSDFYPNSRKLSSKNMNFLTAKTALDYYLSLIREGERFNPYRNPSIGFYGGEPLLNFKVISKCVSYLKQTYPNESFSYNITTNATLLTQDIAHFLMEHDFSIAISLDGPKDEHDRNRVYKNGKGTFEDVMKNIAYIMDQGYEKISSVPVLDMRNDILKTNKFFDNQNIPEVMNINMPKPYCGCTYYNQFGENDYKSYKDMMDNAFQTFLTEIQTKKSKNIFLNKLFGIPAGKVLFSTLCLVDIGSFLIPFTGTCIPGNKMFVDVNGNYYTCERVNFSLPIGNISTGLDFQKISEIMNQYYKNLDKCPSCKIYRLCEKCFSDFEGDGELLKASQLCSGLDRDVEATLSKAFTIGEINPVSLEVSTNEYYSQLSQITEEQ